MLALPILAAAGLHGLVDRPLSARAAITWLGAAAFIFVVWPLLAGGDLVRFAMIAAMLLVAGPLLYGLGTRRWRWASSSAVVGVLTVELLVSAVYAQSYEGGTIFTGLETGDHPSLVPQVLRYPTLDEATYLAPTPIVKHIRAEPGRYATWAPPAAYFEKGYLWMKSPADWPALAPTRGTLFGIPDALGYNPVQLPRYWRYIRATNELSVFYNASVLNLPSAEDVRLLGLRYLIVPTGLEPPVDGRVVEEADLYSLWELDDAQPPATVSPVVEFVDDQRSAMSAITTGGFDPSEQAVIELPSDVFACVGDCSPPADASTRTISGSELVIQIPATDGGILTIRNAYDAGWRAEDRRPSGPHPSGRWIPTRGRPRTEREGGRPHLSRRRGHARPRARRRDLGDAPRRALPRAHARASPCCREHRSTSPYAVSPTAARRLSSPSMNRSMSPPRTRDGSPTSTSVRWSFTIWYGAST